MNDKKNHPVYYYTREGSMAPVLKKIMLATKS